MGTSPTEIKTGGVVIKKQLIVDYDDNSVAVRGEGCIVQVLKSSVI